MSDLPACFFLAQAGSVDLSALSPRQQGLMTVYGLLIIVGALIALPAFFIWWRNPERWHRGIEMLMYRPWDRPMLFRCVLLVLAAFVIANGLAALVYEVAPNALEKESIWVVIQGLLLYGPLLVYLVLNLKRRFVSWKDAFGIQAGKLFRDIRAGLLFYIGTLPFVLLYAWLYASFLESIGVDPRPQEIARIIAGGDSLWLQVCLVFIAGAFAPFLEETLFRGIALPVFVKRWGVTRGVLLVSLAFALIHFHVPSLVPLFVLAVGLSLAYIYTGSIMAPVVMHAAFNLVNVVMMTNLPETMLGVSVP